MTRQTVEIQTSDGVCPASLSIPAGDGPWPAVMMFSDVGGMRDTMREMGERLSGLGYLVLVPDLYYRVGPYEPIDMMTVFESEESRQRIRAVMQTFKEELFVRDVAAFADYLDSRPEKKPGGIGTTGYCMGGRLSLVAAATLGGRLTAAASFHGGNLAKEEDPNSPHHQIGSIQAAVYVAGAVEDASFPDEQKERLERLLVESGVAHTVETYPAKHGFAMPDSPNYDQAAADRHWQATEKLFASALTS